MELNLNSDSSLSSPILKPVHRLRRDLWNISPISEDFSESDKEVEVAVGIGGGDEENANLDLSAVSSTNATFGDSCLVNSSRLNCFYENFLYFIRNFATFSYSLQCFLITSNFSYEF